MLGGQKLRFLFRSDDYVYNAFMEAVIESARTKDGFEVGRIGAYIMKYRPMVSERIFKFYKTKVYGKRFSAKPKKGVVQH